jgi:outer membrane protein OmpA-like peptidoglycan-associated protein
MPLLNRSRINESKHINGSAPLRFAVLTSSLLALLSLNASCASSGKNTAVGAGVGAAAGAVVGAVIGHQTGNREKGALVGAVLGGGMGGLIGNRLDKQKKELEQIAETKRTEQGLVTKLKSDILFDTGKSTLKPSAVSNITQLGEIMRRYPENVLSINGYTDSTGSRKINERLSQDRASAVRAELVRAGLPADTITIVGKADANPVGDNSTPSGRAQNRRVEIEITVDESKVPKN